MKKIIRIHRSLRRSLAALVLAGTFVIQSIAPTRLAAQTALNASEIEKETDKRQMRQIYDAIKAYQKKHGDLPKWLSDLVPDFVANREIFISPVERRTG